MPLPFQTVLLVVALSFPAASAMAQNWQPGALRRAEVQGPGGYGYPGPAPRASLRPGNGYGYDTGYGGLQLDATALLEAQPQQREPAPRPPSPMFSRGWTRDGFGAQSTGWR